MRSCLHFVIVSELDSLRHSVINNRRKNIMSKQLPEELGSIFKTFMCAARKNVAIDIAFRSIEG